MKDVRRELARLFCGVGFFAAAVAALYTMPSDIAEDIGLRAWAATAAVRVALAAGCGAFIGWSGGFLFGEMVKKDDSAGWMPASGHRPRRRRRRRVLSFPPREE